MNFDENGELVEADSSIHVLFLRVHKNRNVIVPAFGGRFVRVDLRHVCQILRCDDVVHIMMENPP